MTRARKALAVASGLLAVGAGGLFLTPFGKAVRDIAGTGVVQSALAKGDRKAEDDTIARLKAIRTALDLYHDSEDRYPDAKNWTEEALKRLAADDLAKGEDAKRLTRPGAKAYGYALNAAVAGKYRGDIGPPTTILVYETPREEPNAAGDPAQDGLPGGKAVTVAGEIVPCR